jgi:hypothetical protein
MHALTRIGDREHRINVTIDQQQVRSTVSIVAAEPLALRRAVIHTDDHHRAA